jgi:hypothetical protein
MKRLIHFALIALTAVHVAAETLVIPQGSETRESPSSTFYPFGIEGDISSQQIFPSSLFPVLGEAGQVFQLDGMALRLASGGNFGFSLSATFDQVEIVISSGNGPFSLDLAANHGANQQIVFDGPLTLSGTVPPGTTPSSFDLHIQFETPFFYNTSSGPLIVEVRKYGDREWLAALGATREVPGMIFFTRSADGTERDNGFGLEVAFDYQVVPEPSAAALLLFGLLFFRWLKCSRN